MNASSAKSAGTTVRRQLLETRHGYMHVRTAGNGGTPLVLLHQSPVSGLQFRRVLPELASDRLVVVPDRIGFGASDPVAPLSIADYAAATFDALDEFGIEGFDLLGVHTGSCEAIELARTQPERVERVCLVAVPHFTDEERAAFKEKFSAPPEPASDGSHLIECWRFFDEIGAAEPRPGQWDAEMVHWLTLNYLLSGTTPHAVFDYPTGELVQKIEQPLLVMLTHDDIWEQTERSIPILPPQTRLLDFPELDAFELFLTAPVETSVAPIREFFD